MEVLISFILHSPVTEYVVATLFMFSLFRFSIKDYIPHTVFFCLLMSYFSATLHQTGAEAIAPSLQMLLFIVCIWLLFRLHLFYALIMGVTGYHAYIIFQLPIMYAMHKCGWWDVDSGDGIEWVQLSTVIIVGAATLIMRRYHLGFTFIPSSETRRVVFHKYNVIMLIVAVSDIVLEGMFLAVYRSKVEELIIIASVIQFLIMLFFLHYSLKKEQNLY